MRIWYVLVIAFCLLPSPGCAWLGETLIDAFSSKKGTSREDGISDTERRARMEEEQIRETLRRFDEIGEQSHS